jgi:hypothetical protein
MSLLCFQKPSNKNTQKLIDSTNTGARAAFLTQSLWPIGDTIRIYFIEPVPTNLKWSKPYTDDEKFLDPLYSTLQGKVDPKTLIRTIVEQRIAPLVNLKFVFTTDITQSDIRILFKEGIGCSSIIGNSRRALKFSDGSVNSIQPLGQPEPTMTYSWLDVSTVLHEFGHAIGMIHEHSNPQNNPIQWNRPAVYCEYRKRNPGWTDEDIEKNVLEMYQSNQINGSEYDPASIMIYSFPKETKCDDKTMSLTLNEPPLSINPNYKFSNSDIEIIKLMYPMTGTRDVKSIENLPVVPTPTYKISDNQVEAIRKFFTDNQVIISSVTGGLISLIIIYKLIRWLFSSRKERRLDKMIQQE